MGIGRLVGGRPQEIFREPELSFPLVHLHQLLDLFFQVLEHLYFRAEFAGGFGGDAHGYP
jgi:hypothetical protein